MKVYIFDPNGYGDFYIILSDSADNALISLKTFFNNKVKNDKQFSKYYERYVEKWENATIDNLPIGYCIKTLNAGDVHEGEYS